MFLTSEIRRLGLGCFLLSYLALSLAGCSSFATFGTPTHELALLLPEGWMVSMHEGSEASVVAATRSVSLDQALPTETADLLTVYIEGDGRAWQSRSVPSDDPTPKSPLALHMALAEHKLGRTAYLARPCQYEARSSAACGVERWTQKRYSRSNLRAMSMALDALKQGEGQLVLVGYSGGGVMAALLAASRDDVTGIITIAANLDWKSWTDHHDVSPLIGSLEPLDYAATLSRIPQVHMVGGRDEVVPPRLLVGYLNSLGINDEQHLILQPPFDHHCCWVDDWEELQNRARGLLNEQIVENRER